MRVKYELAVIGTGPAGQKAAINAAKMGKRVVAIERESSPGGVCLRTGTIPSKAMREAALHLTGYRMRGIYGCSYLVKKDITMADLIFRCAQVMRTEIDVVKAQMQRNGVEMRMGHAAFVDANTLRIESTGGVEEITADLVIIATGTMPARPPEIPFEPGRVIDTDGVLDLQQLPRSIVIVGGGVIGVEYACTLATLGIRVTLIDQRSRLLEFVDAEIAEALQYHMRQMGIRLCLGEAVAEVRNPPGSGSVGAVLESGKEIRGQLVLFSIGRQGNTAGLNLQAAGLSADHRGRLGVDNHLRTEVPHVFAAGDVIGFPALASTSAEQGRLASCNAFGMCCETKPKLMPYGIYTIPEISMVGATEAELTRRQVPYEVGVARYREIARGQLVGDETGMLKLIFAQPSTELLGVHGIGEGATELIHIGQAVMALGAGIDYFVESVFNYPTLAECYKVAALDGINRGAATQRSASAEAANVDDDGHVAGRPIDIPKPIQPTAPEK